MNRSLRHLLLPVCCLLLLTAFIPTAMAEQKTTQVDIYAGLAPIVQLACDDVNFGSWRVPRGLRDGGSTKLTLTLPEVLVTTRIPTRILTFISELFSELRIANIIEPQYSECRLTGSRLNKGTVVSLILTDNDNIILRTASVLNLAAAKTVAAEMKANLSTSDSTAIIDDDGSAVWQITGDFTIPDDLDVDHYGGYSSLSGTTASYSYAE